MKCTLFVMGRKEQGRNIRLTRYYVPTFFVTTLRKTLEWSLEKYCPKTSRRDSNCQCQLYDTLNLRIREKRNKFCRPSKSHFVPLLFIFIENLSMLYRWFFNCERKSGIEFLIKSELSWSNTTSLINTWILSQSGPKILFYGPSLNQYSPKIR